MVRARLSHIERRSQPTEDLWASGQVVAVHAWMQPGGVEVFRPPAHTGIAADAVHRTEPVEDFEQGRVGQVTHSYHGFDCFTHQDHQKSSLTARLLPGRG